MVIFADARAAADCAREMQREVAADPDQIGLRVGINSGELLRDGDDFFGSAVIIARRLCDAAGSGQTLASERTCELLEGASLDGARPVGRLPLKGIAEPVPAAALTWQAAAESAR
jgi:adenylate cyclase